MIIVSELDIPPKFINSKNVEIKIIKSYVNNPSRKRNLGIKNSIYDYIVFLDDDTLLDFDFLDKANHYAKNGEIIFGGPGILPMKSTFKQRVISYAQRSYAFGSYYRFEKTVKSFYVNELHSLNLICHKSIFEKVMFDEKFWPGEDTKLFFDLLKFNHKTLFIGDLYVYHHPRFDFGAYLKQLFRYGKNRARLFIQGLKFNLNKLLYIIPSVFTVYISLVPFLYYFIDKKILFLPLFFYSLFLLACLIQAFFKHKNFSIIFLILLIPFTHISYGLGFINGVFDKSVKLGR